jgi:diketogulonate reductase-like aldo/keto reductase
LKPILDEERSNDHSEAWKAMEGLVASGKVRSIGKILSISILTSEGVSNFNVSQLQKLLKTAKIPPAVHQIEIHPFTLPLEKSLTFRWLTQPALHQFCRDHNILLTAFSPLGGQHPGGHAKHGAQSPLKDETVFPPARGIVDNRSSKLPRKWIKSPLKSFFRG